MLRRLFSKVTAGRGALAVFGLLLLLPALAGEARGRTPAGGAGRIAASRPASAHGDRVNGPGHSLPARPVRTALRAQRSLATKRSAATPRRAPQARGPMDPLQVKALFDLNAALPVGHAPSSVALAGNTVFAVSEEHSALSTDGGATWRQIDMRALFQPTPYWAWSQFKPQICFVPAINRFVLSMRWWIHPLLMEGVTSTRIAVATPEEAANDDWTYWDIYDSAYDELFNGAFGDNYNLTRHAPTLGVGDNYVYLAATTVQGLLTHTLGQVITRIPFTELTQEDSLAFQYLFAGDAGSPGLSPNVGSTAYWGSLIGHNTLRVFNWHESSNTAFFSDYTTDAWTDPAPSIVSPNLNWLEDLSLTWEMRRVSAASRGSNFWLAWNAGPDSGQGRPQTHVRLARIDLGLGVVAGDIGISHATLAIAFPALAANPDGELGYVAVAGGGTSFPSPLAGIITNNHQVFPLSLGDHGPSSEDWRAPGIQLGTPYTRLFLAWGHSLQGGATLSNADRKAVLFGRSGDIPDQYEPDDIPWHGPVLTDPQTHGFHAPGDQDWAYFDLAQPARVILFTSGNSATDDTELTLFDADINTLDSDDDDGADHYSRIETGTLPAGRYYVRVNEYGDNHRIEQYYLTLQVVTGYLLSGTVTLNGGGFGAEVRLYSDPTMAQQLASVESDPSTGHWEYRAPAGSTFFIRPSKSGFTFSAGWFQENIQSDLPGLDFTAAPASPPNPPTGLTGLGFSDTQVLLAFTDQAGDESGFEVRRATSSGGPFTKLNPDAPAAPSGGMRFYLAGGLAPKTSYWFQVRALPQQDPNAGWVTVGPVKTQKQGARLYVPTVVKIPKKGKAKVGQTKTLAVKIQNALQVPIPVAVTQAPAAPFGMTPANPVIPAASSGPLNLTFSFTPTTGTPSTQTQQIVLTLLLPGADVPLPITLQGSAK